MEVWIAAKFKPNILCETPRRSSPAISASSMSDMSISACSRKASGDPNFSYAHGNDDAYRFVFPIISIFLHHLFTFLVNRSHMTNDLLNILFEACEKESIQPENGNNSKVSGAKQCTDQAYGLAQSGTFTSLFFFAITFRAMFVIRLR